MVHGTAEAEFCRRLGVGEGKIVRVAPGVAPLAGSAEAGAAVPHGARVLACMGALEHHKGFRDAIWAFDILRFLYPDLHLLLIGDGPDRPRLERFARDIHCEGAVHFLGNRVDGPALLSLAEVVWVPDYVEGGINVSLEAMAACRAVVASRLPGLSEVIVDGETGVLVPPGRPAELARKTRLLLDDAERRRRMGDAGRRRAAELFPVSELARRASLVYQEVHGGS